MNKAIVKSQAILLPIGTLAAIRSYSFDLPGDYKRLAGFFVQRNTGTEYLKITVKDANGVNLVAPVNIKFLNGGLTQSDSGSLKIEDKFYRKTPFKAAGTKMIVMIENFATTAVAQDLDFVYECDNENV